MNTSTILNYIKNNITQFNSLFGFDCSDPFRNDYELWIGDSEYPGITWLFVGNHGSSLLGLNEFNQILEINDDGELKLYCSSIENIPYEVLRRELESLEDIDELFTLANKRQPSLLMYEKWCKENNITLDKDKEYHYQDGSLLKFFFFDKQESSLDVLADLSEIPFLTILFKYAKDDEHYFKRKPIKDIDWKYYTKTHTDIKRIGIRYYDFSIWAEYHSGETKIITYDFLKLPEILGTKEQYPNENRQFIEYLKENEFTIEPERYT